jgi:hypothetical protein
MTEQTGYPEAGGEEFTAGHSGSDTSAATAVDEARDGRKSWREQKGLELVSAGGWQGLTVAELRNTMGWHHGRASSTLSVLHKAGKIARLAETRGRCKVYVMPDMVASRQTEPYTRQKHRLSKPETEAVGRLRGALDRQEGFRTVVVSQADLSTALGALDHG